MSSEYKADENAIKKIIHKNVKPKNDHNEINLVIYYKNLKTSNLLIANRPKINRHPLQRSHLVYEYTCKQGNCAALQESYIGMTTTKLTRRLTLHLSNGAIKQHLNEKHQAPLTRQLLEANTSIIQTQQDPKRLKILEAIIIQQNNPSMNCQTPDAIIIPTSKVIDPKYRMRHEPPSQPFHFPPCTFENDSAPSQPCGSATAPRQRQTTSRSN